MMMMMMHSAFGGGATRLTRQMKEKMLGLQYPKKKNTAAYFENIGIHKLQTRWQTRK